jgi:uncharacterized protein YceK
LREIKTADHEVGELMALDIPCSAIFDTLLWPIDHLRCREKQ